MDNLREWLSDNLRYIILILGIIVMLLLIFFGIRAVSGIIKGDGEANTEQENNTSQSGSDIVAESETPAETPADPLEKNAYPEINTLISTYYEALGNRDVEKLRTVVDNVNTSEESKIENSQYIDDYTNVEVYTKKGLADDTHVVFASYNYVCTGISTPVPALSQLYVIKDETGYKISQEAEDDAEIQAYVNELLGEEDVKTLVSDTQAAYTAAQESDPALKSFLENLGTSSNQAAQTADGETLTANEGCYVRQEPNSDSEIMGSLEGGEQVKKLGVDGEWIQIEYEGQTGYVFNSLLS